MNATREYLSCAETAKLVRQALKRAFPDAKFSVRSDTYSGGASIDVRWTDGPRAKAVEPIAKQYQGGGFDGMIDMAYSRNHYLRADGSVFLRHDQGTQNSRGSVSEEDNRGLDSVMPSDVRVVRFAADFIFCQREISNEAEKIKAAGAWIMQHCTIEITTHGRAQFGTRDVQEIARAMAHDAEPGEDWQTVFSRRYE